MFTKPSLWRSDKKLKQAQTPGIHDGTLRPKSFPFLIMLALIAVTALGDTLVFRSSFYRHLIEPESTAGLTTLAPALALAQYRPDMKNILIIGDSRIGEGMSSLIANEMGHPKGVNFVVVGEAGTTTRAWYYLLRKLDPDHTKYKSILLMMPSFRDDQSYETFQDRILDTAYLMPLLGITDIKDYAGDFTTMELREQAALNIIFPEILLQKDILEFLQHPVTRVKKVLQWHNYNAEWVVNYPGRTEEMRASADIAPGHLPASLRENLSPQAQGEVDSYFSSYTGMVPPTPEKITAAYRLKWFGKITDAYRGSGTDIKIFLIPRGPYHKALQIPFAPEGSLVRLEKDGTLRLLDPKAGLELETPDNFFDFLHMNRKGRTSFSLILAETELADEDLESPKP